MPDRAPLRGHPLDDAAARLRRGGDWMSLYGPGDPVDGPGWRPGTDQLQELQVWLDQVRGWLESTAGGPVHESVAPTYLTGWYLDALARTGGRWLREAGIVPDLSAGALWLQRQVWPTAARVGRCRFRCAPDHPAAGHPDAQVCEPAALHAAMLRAVHTHAGLFFDSFEPGVPTSSRQQWGMLDDCLDAALRNSPPPASARRRSCCFAFRVDPALLCRRCPRRA